MPPTPRTLSAHSTPVIPKNQARNLEIRSRDNAVVCLPKTPFRGPDHAVVRSPNTICDSNNRRQFLLSCRSQHRLLHFNSFSIPHRYPFNNSIARRTSHSEREVMSCAAGVSSQLTVAMATNPNVNTGSRSEQSSEYKQSVNSHRAMPSS